MGIYLKLFNTIQEYQTYASDISKFILPNVSLCEDEHKLYFNPFTGSKILCKYNVTSTESATTLISSTNNVSSMIVDDVEQEVTKSYTFDTTGEHTVLFTLTDGVTSIGSGTFAGCSRLTSVIISNSVTSIGLQAFTGCSGLTSVIISNSVTIIDHGVFQGCSGLTSITIPDSVTSIGSGVFQNCSSLISITCNATTAPTIQNSTFQDINTGGTLTVPEGSTGYDVWMSAGDYYLGKYGWTKAEV